MKFYMHGRSTLTSLDLQNALRGYKKIFKLYYTSNWNSVLYACTETADFVNRISFKTHRKDQADIKNYLNFGSPLQAKV